MTSLDDTPPILVLADLHGHVDLFDAAVEEGRARAGRADVTVVTLGDYCDNGPDVPALLERLASFGAEHPGEFLPILGNHDLACLMALEHPEGEAWWTRWQLRYANGHAAHTGAQYGATTCAGFRAAFPARHRALLASLPWARRVGDYVFVHAGLEPGDVGPQLQALARRDMTPYAVGHQPPWLREPR